MSPPACTRLLLGSPETIKTALRAPAQTVLRSRLGDSSLEQALLRGSEEMSPGHRVGRAVWEVQGGVSAGVPGVLTLRPR